LTVLARKLAIVDQHIDHSAPGEPFSLYGGECSAPLNLPSCFEDFVDNKSGGCRSSSCGTGGPPTLAQPRQSGDGSDDPGGVGADRGRQFDSAGTWLVECVRREAAGRVVSIPTIKQPRSIEAEPGGSVPSERAEIQVRSDRATGPGELVKFGQPVWYRFSHG